MPLRMFRLGPGESVRYRVRPVGGGDRAELRLHVVRPDEGSSTDLELSLTDVAGGVLDLGRIPLDGGYMAVLREVRRQFDSASNWCDQKDFDLVLFDEEEAEQRLQAGGTD